MAQSEQIKDLVAALAKAQGQITGAKKTSDNPFFKSKYADLAMVWDVARKPLSDNGLAVTQFTSFQGENVVLITQVSHSSGQWMRGVYPILPAKKDPQGYGSAITYARRYCLAAALGIAQEDDDGNAASQPKQKAAMTAKKRNEVVAAVRLLLTSSDGLPDTMGIKQIFEEMEIEEKTEVWRDFTSQERKTLRDLV